MTHNISKKKYKKILLLFSVILISASAVGTYLYFHKISLKMPFLAPKAPPPAPAVYKFEAVKEFQFSDDNALKEWEEKVFRSKVIYQIENDGALSYVRATTDKAASALYYKIKMDARKKHPLISWKWEVKKFPAKKLPESLETKDEDDFAARVYVLFIAPFFTNSKVLEYIWAEKLPVGTSGASPYSSNIQLIVLRSGLDNEEGFKFEERDIMADYLNAFGRPPEHDIGAVAFMTNAEHTESGADAMYDDIKLGYKEDATKEEKGGGL